MTCHEYQQILSPYLDNVLAADERQGVASHVTQCQTCTDVLRQFEQNRQLLHRLPTAEVSDAMEQRLRRKVQGQLPVAGPKSKVQSQQSSILDPLAPSVGGRSSVASWWRGWRVVSVGTLATCAASFLFYFSTVQAPPEVSAEEVVSSMEQLMQSLDPRDAELMLDPDIPEESETVPDWQQEVDGWFFDYETVQE